MQSTRSIARKLVITLWIGLATSGIGALTVYAARPGDAVAIARWPEGTQLARPTRPTLVMALHPSCPCSRASLAELARLQAKAPGALDVVLLIAGSDDAALREGPIAQDAAAIPGARVVADPGGREAARFGARTSGYAVVFDASGAVAFRGGLTASRGHEGDNAGTDAVLAIARRLPPRDATTAVFGCALEAAR